MQKIVIIFYLILFGLLSCAPTKLNTKHTKSVCCNIDSILFYSIEPIINHLKNNNFNCQNCDFIYDIYIFPTNDENICSNIYKQPVTTYKNYFENWKSFTGMVSCYVINSEGKYIAKASNTYLIKQPDVLNAYEKEKELIKNSKINKYIAYANVVCDFSEIYIGFNNDQIDIYRIIDFKTVVLDKSLKIIKLKN